MHQRIPAVVTRSFKLGFFLTLAAAGAARADWPEFRGPWGNGMATLPQSARPAAYPLAWSEKENIRWKTPIPHRGWSTPVVMEGRVWLTTATPDGHDYFVMCVGADSGKVLINKRLFHADKPEPLGNAVNGYASPSPAIEKGRVYITFGSYGTACLDTTDGRVIWERTDLPCRHFRGPGSSLVLFENLLILTMDGVDQQYVVALDKQTGKTVWRTDRTANWDDIGPDGKPKNEGDYRKAYSTPLIIETNGKKQLVSAGAKAFYGYDPTTGTEIWKVGHTGQGNAARPVFGLGLVFFSTGFSKAEMMAIRPDGKGDVSPTHVVWQTLKNASRMSSPVLVDDLLFMASDLGVLSCLDAKTGTEIWKERVGGDVAASLLYADGRIYCSDQNGKTTVVRAGRKYELLAANKLDSGFMASPAASDNSLYLRTRTHLYRIDNAPPAASASK